MMSTLRTFLAGCLVVSMAFGLSACNKKFSAQPSPKPTPEPEKINTIPVEERPFALITPNANGHEVSVTVYDLKKPAKKGEYDLEYQSGTLLQAAGGRINLDELPDTQKVLLGSCSSGGKCSYNENVVGGDLVMRFQDPEKYTLKSEWAFVDNSKTKGTKASSRDAKFVMDGAGMSKVTYITILNSPGYPLNQDRKVLSQVYSVGVAKPLTGKYSVSIRMTEDVSAVDILAWDGKAWKVLPATVAEKVASASTSTFYSAFMVVAK